MSDAPEFGFVVQYVKDIASSRLPLTQRPFGKVFGIRDPEGQPRYVLELAKNRPSQVER